MSQDEFELRTVTRVGPCFEARIDRVLEHGQTAVWNMLTNPSMLPQWLAPGDISLSKGGAAKLSFPESGTNIDSVVTEIDTPRLIEYSWSSPGEPERPLRWEVTAIEGGARLSLTLRIPNTEDIARACAGWECHLEMLAAALEDVPIKFPFQRFKAAREAYRTLVS
jgi:uncharacterized protein YndB with AHSA1/START domain